MEQTFNRREWLEWLTGVRLLMIALILGVGVVWPQFVPSTAAPRYFLPIIILWITISVLHLMLVRLLPPANWFGVVQVLCDVPGFTAEWGFYEHFSDDAKRWRRRQQPDGAGEFLRVSDKGAPEMAAPAIPVA